MLLVLGVVYPCYAQNNEMIMIDKYDFSLDAEMKKASITDTIVKKENSLVFVNQMLDSGTFSKEYPVSPSFYVTQKNYYPNGNLKSSGKYVGKYVLVRNWLYYNEDGSLENKINEDGKFGKIDSDQILSFLNKEEHINLETGEGREEIDYRESGKGYIKNGVFVLEFFKKGEYVAINNEYPLWIITIYGSPKNNFHQTRYHVEGNTGKVISKEIKQILKHE